MDADGFKRWLDLCQASFAFVDKLANDGQVDRFRLWQRALEPVSEDLAIAYVEAVVAGTVRAPRFPSDWDSFASECRVWCQAEEARRNPPPPRQRPDVEPDRQKRFREALREHDFGRLADRLDRDDPLMSKREESVA